MAEASPRQGRKSGSFVGPVASVQLSCQGRKGSTFQMLFIPAVGNWVLLVYTGLEEVVGTLFPR